MDVSWSEVVDVAVSGEDLSESAPTDSMRDVSEVVDVAV